MVSDATIGGANDEPREDPALNNGVWFLDPAQIIAMHFPRETPAGSYVSNPYLGIFR